MFEKMTSRQNGSVDNKTIRFGQEKVNVYIQSKLL